MKDSEADDPDALTALAVVLYDIIQRGDEPPWTGSALNAGWQLLGDGDGVMPSASRCRELLGLASDGAPQ